ncbi:phage DNA recombinase [Sphingomonas sp. LH128]|uniref:phage DNA recombinase n=1 Tax=Sphingomonas sp. LH128 TaxID=473781 RepID=UPI00027CA6A8|nr:phage DNA recombinase [Sphingomonas sp. LH128]EJU14647.1 phage DNA recombinase [Sphingomonas sp. LH128]
MSHLERWLDAAAIVGGPVFLNWTPQGRLSANAMSAHGAELDIKAAAAAAGYDPSCFSGHSLGAGFLPEAANESEDLFSMKAQSRYKTTEVLAGYVRREDGVKTSAAWKFS